MEPYRMPQQKTPTAVVFLLILLVVGLIAGAWVLEDKPLVTTEQARQAPAAVWKHERSPEELKRIEEQQRHMKELSKTVVVESAPPVTP